MANLDAPKGLVPIASPHGTDIPTLTYQATTNISIYPGQILYLVDTGLVSIWTGTATGYNQIVGSSLDLLAAATADRAVGVAYHPEQHFEIQADDNSITALTDFLGANMTAVNFTTVSSTRGISLIELDASSATTVNNSTTIMPLRSVRYRQGPENVLGTNVDIVVRFNSANHIHATGAAID